MNTQKQQQQPKLNKRNEHIIWKQKLETKTKDTEEYIKYGKKEKIEPIMSQIDEEKYPIISNKYNSNEMIKESNQKKDSKSQEQQRMNYLPYAEEVLADMKQANKDIIIENAKFVIKHSNIANLNDKKNLDFSEDKTFNYQTYKYINDKLLPQIIKNSMKQNTSAHLKLLKLKAEQDSKVKKYCREIEEKIEKDVEFKLSNNYYKKKNKDLEKIFSNMPDNYYIKKTGKTLTENLSKGSVGKSDKKKVNNRSYISSVESNSYSMGKDNNLITGTSEKNNIANYLHNSPPNYSTQPRKNIGKKNKKNINADKKKSLKSFDQKSEVEKSCKETIDNIFHAIDSDNIERYILAPNNDKSKYYIIVLLFIII